MAEVGPGIDVERQEKLVKDYYRENRLSHFVNKDVFFACYGTIRGWLENNTLLPYLMKYGLVTSQEDSETLTSPYYLPKQRRDALLHIAQRGGDNGFFVLYMCIRESQAENPHGHGSAVRELERCAAQRSVRPPWEMPPRDYRENRSQQESGQDLTSSSQAITDHGGQPSPAVAVQDLVQTSVAKVSPHNLSESNRKEQYAKPHSSPSSIIRGKNTSQQTAIVTPIQETHASFQGGSGVGSTSNHSNRFERHGYGGDEVERDQSDSVPVEKGGEQYRQQMIGEEVKKNHAAIRELVSRGEFSSLSNDSRDVFLLSDNEHPSEESMRERLATLTAACLNSRTSQRTGVIVLGVDPDNYHVRDTHVQPQAIQQFLLDSVVRQNEESDHPVTFTPSQLSMVQISQVQLQAGGVVLVSVHPSWELCCQAAVYRCRFRDKNGRFKLEPVHRIKKDDLDTTCNSISFNKMRDFLKKGPSGT